MRLLIVEDDAMIGHAMLTGTRKVGFAVDWVRTAQQAKLSLANGVYDLVILDLGLADKDGMEVLAALRATANQVPVLIATARDSVKDRIAGLEAGADDYVLKPFDLDELIARMRALLRRHVGTGSRRVSAGPVVLDPSEQRVWCDGKEVSLSNKEFAILHTLMRRPGAIVSRESLEESVYPWGHETASNAIEVHLHRLRRKLGAPVIRNVRGVGYRVSV